MGYIAELRKRVGSRPLIMAGAGVLVLDEAGRLLLQKRVDNGLWGLIGGAMEPGESLEQTARRELKEEAGLEAGELELFSLVSGADYHYVYPNGDEVFFVSARFVTREVRGEARADGREGLELRYFGLNGLPEVTVNDRTHLPALRQKLSRGEL